MPWEEKMRKMEVLVVQESAPRNHLALPPLSFYSLSLPHPLSLSSSLCPGFCFSPDRRPTATANTEKIFDQGNLGVSDVP